MSSGHYTALVDAHAILHRSLERIAQSVHWTANDIRAIARYALADADKISNNQPKETNNVTK